MNLKRCDNGHFYDGEKYSSCPHCSGASAGGYDGGSDTIAASDDFATTADTVPSSGSVFGGGGFSGGNGGFGGFQQGNAQDIGPTVPTGPSWDNEPDDTGKTMRATELFNDIGTDPVVGWLVAVNGECTGESFKLVGRKNFIGRNSDMDVALRGDASVSRVKHAILLYEPHSKIFLVQPGESRELFYLNGKVVLNTEEIKAYDRLLIGKTELLFIPLCGEKFSWEDELKKEEK